MDLAAAQKHHCQFSSIDSPWRETIQKPVVPEKSAGGENRI
jgi:hypothetical protein